MTKQEFLDFCHEEFTKRGFKLLCTRQKKNTKIRSCFVKNGQKYWSVYIKFVTIVTESETR